MAPIGALCGFRRALLLSLLLQWRAAALNYYPDVLDVVTMAVKPTCVNRAMVASVNRFLVPKPRYIHIIAVRNCKVFRRFATNVICYQEDTFMPGLSLKNVSEFFKANFRTSSREERERVLDRSTWYFQQLLKLAASTRIPGISEHFLIFDSDMIALKPLTWFLPLGSPVGTRTGEVSSTESDSAIFIRRSLATSSSSSSSSASCTSPFPFLQLVHIGGWSPPYGYMDTYKKLFGKSIKRGPDRSSLVTHNMLVYRPFMKEFLANITSEKYRNHTYGWALSILSAVTTLPGASRINVGFSEYWSYLSWVLENYPCTAVPADTVEWLRTPMHMEVFTLPVHVWYRGSFISVCCPTTRQLEDTEAKGYLFTGFELAHRRECQYRHEAFKEGYAEWYVAT